MARSTILLWPTPQASWYALIDCYGPRRSMARSKLMLWPTPQEFVSLIARKHGRLRKGGIPDRIAAARTVLRDLYTGKLPFYTLPPSGERPADKDAVDASIVTSWAKEMDLDALYEKDSQTITGAASELPTDDYMAVE